MKELTQKAFIVKAEIRHRDYSIDWMSSKADHAENILDPSPHLAGFAYALTVLGHGSGHPMQPCSNNSGKGLACFQLGLIPILALP